MPYQVHSINKVGISTSIIREIRAIREIRDSEKNSKRLRQRILA